MHTQADSMTVIVSNSAMRETEELRADCLLVNSLEGRF